MRPALPAALAAAVLCLAACAPPPGTAIPVPAAEAAAPWPALVPLGPVLAEAGQPGRADPEAGDALAARAAALRARAAGLRRPVVEPGARARMEGGVATGALP